jgi:hypothetical protein
MAEPHLTLLHSPEFPQVFSSAIDQMVARIAAKPELALCAYEERIGSYNDHNSELCHRLAVVHDLESDLDFCARHFAEVARGR